MLRFVLQEKPERCRLLRNTLVRVLLMATEAAAAFSHQKYRKEAANTGNHDRLVYNPALFLPLLAGQLHAIFRTTSCLILSIFIAVSSIFSALSVSTLDVQVSGI